MTRRNSLKSRTICFDAHAVTDNRGRTRLTCHAEKSGNDWSEIAHGRRAMAKHFGIKEKRAWRR